jgi:hypothetical protein
MSTLLLPWRAGLLLVAWVFAGNAWGWGSSPDPGTAALKAFMDGGTPANPAFGAECISHDAADRCELRRRVCQAGETTHFSELSQVSISYSEPGKPLSELPTWVVYKPCAFGAGLGPDDALALLGLKRGGFYAWAPDQGFMVYETSRQGVYAGVRQDAAGSNRSGHAVALLTLRSELQQRAAFKHAQPPVVRAAEYFQLVRTGQSFLGFLPCPLDARDRQATLDAARESLATADMGRHDGFLARAQLLAQCGAGDEALVQMGRWLDQASGDDAGLLAPLRRHPELRPGIAAALLRQASAYDVQRSLKWLPALLAAHAADGEPLDAAARARFERRLAGWPQGIGYDDLKPVLRQCKAQRLPAELQQRARVAADRAVAERRLATAVFLYHCLDDFAQKVPLGPSPEWPLPAATPRESALRIGAWMMDAFNLAPAEGSVLEPEAATDDHAFRFARLWIADHLNVEYQTRLPQRPIELVFRLDARQVSNQGLPAREVWVGGDDGDSGRDAESRRKELSALTDSARQLVARRDALAARIEVLDERIRNPGVTRSGTRASTAPVGGTTSTRFWTDKHGITHRETTTGTQGGQTMGGEITMPNLTVDAQQERREKRAELEGVNRELDALQKKGRAVSSATPAAPSASPRRRVSVSGYSAWRGPVSVEMGYRYQDRDLVVTHSKVLDRGERGTPFSQLVAASGLNAEQLWRPAGLQLVGAILDQQLQSARGTPSQRAAEAVLAKRLVARPTAEDLESLELQVLDDAGL